MDELDNLWSGPWPWSPRCKAKITKKESKYRYGRCELKPHSEDVDHALEFGLEHLRWNSYEYYRELTGMGNLVVSQRLEEIERMRASCAEHKTCVLDGDCPLFESCYLT